jgi:hypothetical protein
MFSPTTGAPTAEDLAKTSMCQRRHHQFKRSPIRSDPACVGAEDGEESGHDARDDAAATRTHSHQSQVVALAAPREAGHTRGTEHLYRTEQKLRQEMRDMTGLLSEAETKLKLKEDTIRILEDQATMQTRIVGVLMAKVEELLRGKEALSDYDGLKIRSGFLSMVVGNLATPQKPTSKSSRWSISSVGVSSSSPGMSPIPHFATMRSAGLTRGENNDRHMYINSNAPDNYEEEIDECRKRNAELEAEVKHLREFALEQLQELFSTSGGPPSCSTSEDEYVSSEVDDKSRGTDDVSSNYEVHTDGSGSGDDESREAPLENTAGSARKEDAAFLKRLDNLGLEMSMDLSTLEHSLQGGGEEKGDEGTADRIVVEDLSREELSTVTRSSLDEASI